MFSRTGEYAVRAVVHLARHEADWPISGPTIARKTDIPPKYLSAILGNLVRTGVLAATRGKRGGFRIAEGADETTLLQVLEPFEGRLLGNDSACPFGLTSCSDDNPCPVHFRWKDLRDAFLAFLQETSIGDVARGDSDQVTLARMQSM